MIKPLVVMFTAALVASISSAIEPLPAGKPEKGARYEVYICGGQSNMDGRAPAKGLTGELAVYAQPRTDVLIRHSSNGLHRKLRASSGLIALRPGLSENPACFGPELAFGHTMAEARKGRKILLVKVAEGGTNLYADWNPAAPNKLYARLLDNVRKTLEELEKAGASGTITGAIWMQGESDSGKGHAEHYAKNLTAFIARLRSDLNAPKMPFVIGQICVANPSFQKVIGAQKAVAQSVSGVAIASAEGLKTTDRNVHFDAPSQIELGKRFAAGMLKLVK